MVLVGAIFRTRFNLGTESIVRVSVRVHSATLTGDSPYSQGGVVKAASLWVSAGDCGRM